MKLAIYIRSVKTARGAERVSANIARGLVDRGHTVDFLVEDDQGWLADELRSHEGLQLINLRASGESLIQKLFRLLSALQNLFLLPFDLARGRGNAMVATARVLVRDKPPIYALQHYLRQQRPDAILSFLNYPNLALLLSARLGKRGARVYVSVRNQISMSSRHGKSKWARSVPGVMRRFFPIADGVVAPSLGVARDVVQVARIKDSKVAVIHNPVFRPEILELARQPAGHEWLDAAGKPVIVAAGKMKPQKDFSTLLRAFANLRQRLDARLIILGEGRQYDMLQSLARELDVQEHVDMPGQVKNPYAYFSRASLFVLSSAWEGLPNVLIEALACGAPVVSTDCPSGPAEILDNGRYGRLVPVGDADRLAQAMEESLTAPLSRQDCVQRAREFSFERSVTAYEKLLGASGPPGALIQAGP